MSADYYQRLGVPPDASEEEIKGAFRRAARRLHPDVNVETGATEMFLDIKEAYEVLIDPRKRSSFDGKSDGEYHHPIRTQIQYSRNTISWLTEEQLVYTLIEMEILADQLNKNEKPPPINFGLVLDTSTSMQGERLDFVKSSAIELVRQLKPLDLLSIVAFSDRAETILPSSINSNPQRSENRIRMLQASGGTEIYQGLIAGVSEVRRNLSPYYINHVILITDGHTYGDESHCLELARRCADNNIGLSCLGIGHEWNDVLLDELANTTGGSCTYIKDPAELKTFLKQKFEGFGQVYAKDVTMNLVTGSGVDLKYAYRLQPETNVLPISSSFKLGDIPKSTHLSVLLEFLVTPVSPSIKSLLMADGSLVFSIPMLGDSAFRVPITFYRSTSANNQPHPPPKKIIEAMSRLTLYRMQEQAKAEVKVGNYLDASNRLQHMATNLFSQGESKLAKTILNEAKNIENHHEYSEEGQKQIKYGTRALISPVAQQKAIRS